MKRQFVALGHACKDTEISPSKQIIATTITESVYTSIKYGLEDLDDAGEIGAIPRCFRLANENAPSRQHLVVFHGAI